MKSPEEFRNKVYEKQAVRLTVRKRRRRQAMVCVPLAFLIVLGSVFLPRVLTDGSLPFARSGKIPLMLQVTSPAVPTKMSATDEQTSHVEERKKLEEEREALEKTLKEAQGEQKEETSMEDELKKRLEEMQRKVEEARARERAETEVDSGFADSVNQFARDSSVLLSKDFGENACYSPLSMYYAMALTGCGAGGQTKEEFQSILYGDDNWIAEQCRKFYQNHYFEGETNTFRLENSLWLDGNYDFSGPFISHARNDFFSSLFRVDFSDPALSGEMTKWVSEQTDGQLSPSFTFEDHQMLYLLNTILYEAEWNQRFSPENNTQGEFRKADGSTVTAEYMNRDYSADGYYKGNGFTAASLSLKSHDRMVFVLPDEGVSTEELLSDPNLFEEMFLSKPLPEHEYGLVRWSIPKFSFTCEYDMQNVWKGLGLERAFDPVLADFSDMGKLEMYLTKTTQNIHMDISENGVTAAAFSEVITHDGINELEGERVDMVLDRPFLFAVLGKDAIMDNEITLETLLFVGVCGDPAASDVGSAAAAS